MSDFVTASNALRTRLQAFTALPIVWPNSDKETKPGAYKNGFVSAHVRLQDEQPITLGATGSGARYHRDYGELEVFVYVPRGTKVGTAEAHAQTIRNLFAMDAVTGVVVTRKYIGAGQHVDGPQGRHWALPILIEWFSDRTE